MVPLEATSQPPSCADVTLTGGQSRLCTTAVGASTNFPDGEYSIRTSEGVRNSKRAFPAATAVVPDCAPDCASDCVAAHAPDGARPTDSARAATATVQKVRMRGVGIGARRVLLRCRRWRTLLADEDVCPQSSRARHRAPRLTRGVEV